MSDGDGPGRDKKLTEDSVIEAFRRSNKPGLSASMIADRTGTSRQTVHRRLEKEGAVEEWGLFKEKYGQTTVYFLNDDVVARSDGGLSISSEGEDRDRQEDRRLVRMEYELGANQWVLDRRILCIRSALFIVTAILILITGIYPGFQSDLYSLATAGIVAIVGAISIKILAPSIAYAAHGTLLPRIRFEPHREEE